MLKQRIITGLVLVTLFLAALFALPAIGWSVLVFGMVMLGTTEWGRLSKLSDRGAMAYWWVAFAVMAGVIGFEMANAARPAWLYLFPYVLSALFWLVLAPLWLVQGWQVRNRAVMALVGGVVLIPTGLAMMELRATSAWVLLGVMALVWMADVSAYFAGRKFGKRKLAPSISPGKTWEGVAGAVLGVSLYVVLVGRFSGLVHGYLNFVMVILVSWLWVALSVIGDLFESAVKRQAGVKDSGSLLPGHGGILDRIDALTPTLPLAALALSLWGMMA